jgi:hypothetical protein
MKKSNFPLVSTVLFFITAIVTVFLFYYLSEEKSRTSLFVFNLIYVCFLELLFFGYITLVRYSKIHSTAIYAAGGSLIISYIVIAAIIVISYNLFLNQFLSTKFYISAIIIGTTLTIIIYGFLIKLNTHHTTTTEIDKSKRISLQLIVQNFELLQGKFERVVKSKNLVDKNQSGFSNSLERLTTKIKFLPPSATENINFLSTIQNYEQELKQMINQLETTEDGTEKDLKNKIENIVSDAIINIESSKKSFLK